MNQSTVDKDMSEISDKYTACEEDIVRTSEHPEHAHTLLGKLRMYNLQMHDLLTQQSRREEPDTFMKEWWNDFQKGLNLAHKFLLLAKTGEQIPNSVGFYVELRNLTSALTTLADKHRMEATEIFKYSKGLYVICGYLTARPSHEKYVEAFTKLSNFMVTQYGMEPLLIPYA